MWPETAIATKTDRLPQYCHAIAERLPSDCQADVRPFPEPGSFTLALRSQMQPLCCHNAGPVLPYAGAVLPYAGPVLPYAGAVLLYAGLVKQQFAKKGFMMGPGFRYWTPR